ncbi:MAG: signal peptide peptidase SppA [Thermodesulfobacteriota bacterium]|nr:signal peptide peptidase SppA [Thermodesulfobacteriota bacterium]
MKLMDIMAAPWMITRERLNEIRALYAAHLRGDKIDIKGITAKVDVATGKRDKQSYEIVNGAAVIPLKDVITKNLTFWTFFFGGTSTLETAKLFTMAMEDPAVESIILDVDSPGGTVDGTQDLANLIYGSRGEKPIVTWSDGMIASAAYYIASAADRIYISGGTQEIGSIGVVTSHVDYSKLDEMRGIKETEIYAGKYKRIASSTEPLSVEGREYLQDQVDYVYSIVVDDVSKYRGVSIDQTLAMADGKIFIGKQAITAGLVDGVATFDQLINNILPGLKGSQGNNFEEEMNQLLKGANMKNFESLVSDLIASGMKRGDAIRQTVKDHPETHEAYIQKLKTEGERTRGSSPSATPKTSSPFLEAVGALASQKGCSRGQAVSIVARTQPKLHAQYLKELEEGNHA